MTPERHDDDDSPRAEDRGTIGDAYAPPVPPSKATRSKFMLGVVAVLAVCIVVFVVAVQLR